MRNIITCLIVLLTNTIYSQTDPCGAIYENVYNRCISQGSTKKQAEAIAKAAKCACLEELNKK